MLTAVAPWFPSMAACYTILVVLVIYFLTPTQLDHKYPNHPYEPGGVNYLINHSFASKQ